MTHVGLDPEIKEFMGINERLVRLSIGLEHEEDLIMDIENALRQV